MCDNCSVFLRADLRTHDVATALVAVAKWRRSSALNEVRLFQGGSLTSIVWPIATRMTAGVVAEPKFSSQRPHTRTVASYF
jgi:hypothetical protein